jgi:F420-0:gamma-glutamyl ligase
MNRQFYLPGLPEIRAGHDLARVIVDELAGKTGKDPRLVEVILSESQAVMRAVPNVLIVRHRLGYVMANAGVDRSNVPNAAGEENVLLLPADPDASAARLREALMQQWLALADAIAAGAALMMGEADEATPIVIARGAAVLRRSKEQDLFQ